MNLTGFYTLLAKELKRMLRIWQQTILTPVITTTLYFVVFGSALGSRINSIEGIRYIQFIIPGLIMMSLLANSLMSSSTGVFIARFQGSIIDILVSPLSYLEITLAFAFSSAIRALIIGFVIWLVSLFFTSIAIFNPLYVILFSVLVSFTFALFGIIIGIWAENFDKLSLVPTFIITPLSFLGGIFYSIKMLPEFWQKLSLFNPVFYMIDGLRYGFFGKSDLNPNISLVMVLVFLLIFSAIAWRMFKTGYKIRT